MPLLAAILRAAGWLFRRAEAAVAGSVGFLAGFLAVILVEGFFAARLSARTFLVVFFWAASFVLAGLPVAALDLLLSFELVTGFVFATGLGLLRGCLGAVAF